MCNFNIKNKKQEVIYLSKRITEKYLRYYRMLYQPPTPSVVNQ